MLPEKENLDMRPSTEFLRDFEELYKFDDFSAEKPESDYYYFYYYYNYNKEYNELNFNHDNL